MQITVTPNRISIAHQCPLCCVKHYNGHRRLCDSCNRKAFAVDLLGAVAVFACVAFIGAAILTLS